MSYDIYEFVLFLKLLVIRGNYIATYDRVSILLNTRASFHLHDFFTDAPFYLSEFAYPGGMGIAFTFTITPKALKCANQFPLPKTTSLPTAKFSSIVHPSPFFTIWSTKYQQRYSQIASSQSWQNQIQDRGMAYRKSFRRVYSEAMYCNVHRYNRSNTSRIQLTIDFHKPIYQIALITTTLIGNDPGSSLIRTGGILPCARKLQSLNIGKRNIPASTLPSEAC